MERKQEDIGVLTHSLFDPNLCEVGETWFQRDMVGKLSELENLEEFPERIMREQEKTAFCSPEKRQILSMFFTLIHSSGRTTLWQKG